MSDWLDGTHPFDPRSDPPTIEAIVDHICSGDYVVHLHGPAFALTDEHIRWIRRWFEDDE